MIDIVNGFIALAESDATIGEEVNIATGVEHTIGDVANYLVSEINPSAKLIVEEERFRPEKSEVFRLIGDTRKIMSLTSWKPPTIWKPDFEIRYRGLGSQRIFRATRRGFITFKDISMRAIILAGGKGIRLRPYTTLIPKPMVPLGGRMSILEVVLNQLAQSGFTHVHVGS